MTTRFPDTMQLPFIVRLAEDATEGVLESRDELTLVERRPAEVLAGTESVGGTLITRVQRETTDNE